MSAHRRHSSELSANSTRAERVGEENTDGAERNLEEERGLADAAGKTHDDEGD